MSDGGNRSPGGVTNPFAAAMESAKTPEFSEQSGYSNDASSDVLSGLGDQYNPDIFDAQQKAAAEQEKAKRTYKLKEVNPIDKHLVFTQQHQETLKKIEQIRQNLLQDRQARQAIKAHHQVQGTLQTVVERQPGQGDYWINFYHTLRLHVVELIKQFKANQAAEIAARKAAQVKARQGGGGKEGVSKAVQETTQVQEDIGNPENNPVTIGA